MAKTNSRSGKPENDERSWRKVKDWRHSTIPDQVSLVEAALAGDDHACRVFDKLYRRFIEWEIRMPLITKGLYSEDAVEELTSVLEEKLLFKMRKLIKVGNWCATREEGPLKNWMDKSKVDVRGYIRTVARNFMNDELKDRAILRPTEWDYDSERLENMECSPEKGPCDNIIRAVWKAVRQLEEPMRRVMTLHLKECTGKKIASELGISEVKVSRLRKAAREKMRKILGEMHFD